MSTAYDCFRHEVEKQRSTGGDAVKLTITLAEQVVRDLDEAMRTRPSPLTTFNTKFDYIDGFRR